MSNAAACYDYTDYPDTSVFSRQAARRSATAVPFRMRDSTMQSPRWPEYERSVFIAADLPVKYQEVSECIKRFTGLAPNWDSYGSSTISVDAVRNAIGILTNLSALGLQPPQAVPMSHGGVQLEWHPVGLDLEIECTPDGRFQVFMEIAGEAPVEGELTQKPEIFLRAVEKLA